MSKNSMSGISEVILVPITVENSAVAVLLRLNQIGLLVISRDDEEVSTKLANLYIDSAVNLFVAEDEIRKRLGDKLELYLGKEMYGIASGKA